MDKPKDLVNCKFCGSDNIQIVSGVSFAVKCMSCFKIKIQCCDSPEEAAELWNKFNRLEQESI